MTAVSLIVTLNTNLFCFFFFFLLLRNIPLDINNQKRVITNTDAINTNN